MLILGEGRSNWRAKEFAAALSTAGMRKETAAKRFAASYFSQE
jgi:hypothetical protein